VNAGPVSAPVESDTFPDCSDGGILTVEQSTIVFPLLLKIVNVLSSHENPHVEGDTEIVVAMAGLRVGDYFAGGSSPLRIDLRLLVIRPRAADNLDLNPSFPLLSQPVRGRTAAPWDGAIVCCAHCAHPDRLLPLE